MFDPLFWAFIALAALLTISPGADTVLTLRNTLSGGTRAGLYTAAGVCSGFVFQPLLATLGVAALFVKLPLAFAAVKMAGAVYLVFLGVRSLSEAIKLWRARNRHEEVRPGEPQAGSGWERYREGLLTNALNPKIAVFYFAVLPQFIKPGDPVLLKSMLMTFCHYVMGMIWLGGIAICAGQLRRILIRLRVKAGLEGLSGLAMIGFGAKLAFSRAR
jgi:threonine/homoserine/homoserine lactone efflux protein